MREYTRLTFGTLLSVLKNGIILLARAVSTMPCVSLLWIRHSILPLFKIIQYANFISFLLLWQESQ
jgi:hypothetical protein